ncbi:MAG: hypothetical protein M0R40_03755 [Firmicutes bacterium]|nr:hypothetical protein [Bacillota bacterium]
MTSIERISNILKRKPVDRIGIYEHFWSDTHTAYTESGHIGKEESFEDHFNLDLQECWAFNLKADLDFVPEVISETEETITMLDGNGAYLKRHKLHDTTPEHVDFTVKSRKEWEEYKPLLANVDERRINFQRYQERKEHARKNNRFFVWSGVNVFECMHPICGHENMLIGMALDPEWVMDMAATYADLTMSLMEILFSKEGKPDGIWFYEDMGFKGKPFMSPSMYEELIKPFHIKFIEYAHSMNLPVIMHSCGFVEPLLPKMIEAGIDCLQVIEVKAGMDLLRIHKNFGDRLSLMGGIDVRTLYSNDKAIIDKELESKIPIVKEGFGYALHSDHSIPKTVNYETLQYYIEKGLSLGKY